MLPPPTSSNSGLVTLGRRMRCKQATRWGCESEIQVQARRAVLCPPPCQRTWFALSRSQSACSTRQPSSSRKRGMRGSRPSPSMKPCRGRRRGHKRESKWVRRQRRVPVCAASQPHRAAPSRRCAQLWRIAAHPAHPQAPRTTALQPIRSPSPPPTCTHTHTHVRAKHPASLAPQHAQPPKPTRPALLLGTHLGVHEHQTVHEVGVVQGKVHADGPAQAGAQDHHRPALPHHLLDEGAQVLPLLLGACGEGGGEGGDKVGSGVGRNGGSMTGMLRCCERAEAPKPRTTQCWQAQPEGAALPLPRAMQRTQIAPVPPTGRHLPPPGRAAAHPAPGPGCPQRQCL